MSIFWLLPDHYNKLVTGAQSSIALLDITRLWDHWVMLFHLLGPLATYHRYIDVGATTIGPYEWIYRWVFVLVCISSIAYGALRALYCWRQRSNVHIGAVFLGTVVAIVLAAMVKTSESWSSHHVILIKPFAHACFAMVLFDIATKWPRAGRRSVICLILAMTAANSIFGAMGYRAAIVGKRIHGVYDVSWNAIDAVNYAAASGETVVYALDWGVFYPGTFVSPSDQLWEMKSAKSPRALSSLRHARRGMDFMVVFKQFGSHKWILREFDPSKRPEVQSFRLFSDSPGESWCALVLNMSADA